MGKSEKRDKSKKKHKHKEHKSKKSKKHKSHKKHRRTDVERKSKDEQKNSETIEEPDNFEIPVELMNSKSHAPETPQEYQKRQSQIRRIEDPETGRIRLIRGDGEVLEEIVSKERHTDINKKATQSDGRYFAEQTVGRSTKKS